MADKKTKKSPTIVHELTKTADQMTKPTRAVTEMADQMTALSRRIQNPLAMRPEVAEALDKALRPAHSKQLAEMIDQAKGPPKSGAAYFQKVLAELQRDPVVERLNEISQLLAGAKARLDEIEKTQKLLVRAVLSLANGRTKTSDLGTTAKKKKPVPN